MCAIVDASGANDVFGKNRPEIGVAFFDWINDHGRILTGGKLTMEIGDLCPRFLEWAKEAERTRKLVKINHSKKIRTEMAEVIKRKRRGSPLNDAHILAIARLGRARLLYANDKDLLENFVDARLIARPPGDTMTSLGGGDLTDEDRETLERATERCRQQMPGHD